ncbi:hypothetical protein BSR29_06775 [Boudabousia liubingyangii]|uniref:Solute-binding protein family 5 domain-containing protein n=1 Tax=Boudabousia liubingyangii TaxID=1921764 RepID=A0A1Q5PL04_9ACTO|nr:ABC transporter family substrate-binding protein [Boudabousia liubingyangii]OKL47310.1 hypothetical protein BSR29_06775 [Boudabousia liubingyangii]
MKRITSASIAILAASSLLLAGCGSSSSKEEGPKVTSSDLKGADYKEVKYEDLKDGGELHLPQGPINAQMQPLHADANTVTLDIFSWYNLPVSLFTADAKWYANPELIESVKDETKDGKTVVTWKINPKATFNDGTPIDWHAFETVWKTCNGTDDRFQPQDTDGYRDIESIKPGADDKEVVVTYKIPYPWWKKNFEYILHPKMADPETFNNGYLDNAHPEWGSGPYKLESIDRKAGTVTFVKNEKWWGKPGKLDRITMRELADKAEINAFKNGQIDVTNAGTKETLTEVKKMENVDVYTAAGTSFTIMMANARSEIMNDKKVREAFFHSIDRPTVLKVAYNGINYTEDPLTSALLRPYQEGYSDNLGELGKYDPALANKLLDEAGWVKDGDYRKKDGKLLEVHIPQFGTKPTTSAIYGTFQAMGKATGFKVEIDTHPYSDYMQVIRDGSFDLFFQGFPPTNPFGMADLYQFYNSKSRLSKTGLGTPELDEKLKKAGEATSEEEALKLSNEAEKAVLEQAGWLPMYTGPVSVATKKGLANTGSMGFAKVPKELIGWTK